MFFIRMVFTEKFIVVSVLIPLDQGCFLFLCESLLEKGIVRLNPFGSGMFFILNHIAETAREISLNPFGSGMFFILLPKTG